MEKFNKMTAIWGEQNEKYLRSVVVYADVEDKKLYYDKELTKSVKAEDAADLFLKRLLVICYESGEMENLYFYESAISMSHLVRGGVLYVGFRVMDQETGEAKEYALTSTAE